MNNGFWEELFKDVPVMLQDGEKTISMMINELGRPMDFKTMQNQVKRWVAEGKLEPVGKRIVANGKAAEAYRVSIVL